MLQCYIRRFIRTQHVWLQKGDAGEQPGSEDWLFLFQLPPGRDALAAVRSSAVLLDYLLSRRPHSHDGG